MKGHHKRRHHVRAYDRSGKHGHRVKEHMRGHGSPQNIERRTRRFKRLSEVTGGEPKPFTVNFQYSKKKGDGESVIVISRSYKKALDEAFEERRDKRDPISVEVIDPDFGRMFRAIGGFAKKAGKAGAHATLVGAKYSLRGAKLFGKSAALEITRRMDTYEEKLRAKKLIRESYSRDRETRLMARAKLREEFPTIYTVSDFSRPGETLYEVSKKPRNNAERPIIIQHKRTLIQLRVTMKRKGIRPIKVTARKKGEALEEYERRLYRNVKWAQAAIEKAERAKEQPLKVESR